MASIQASCDRDSLILVWAGRTAPAVGGHRRMPPSRRGAVGLGPGPGPTARVLQDTDQHCRNLGVPHEHQDEEYRIRTEVVIYYFDAEWGNASGECMGTPRWLPIDSSPIALKAGQRVAIDGVIIPQREQFVWTKPRFEYSKRM